LFVVVVADDPGLLVAFRGVNPAMHVVASQSVFGPSGFVEEVEVAG